MYHYTDCGLPDVFLANGYERKETPYGTGTTITDVEGLHRSLGLWLSKAPAITGDEFRFLRRELDISQAKLGLMLGKSEQSVARYEKSRDLQNGPHVRLLQVLYREAVTGNARVSELVRCLQDLDKFEHHRKLILQSQDGGWQAKAA